MNIVHIEAGRYLYGGAAQVLMLLKGLRERSGRQVLICAQGSAIAETARSVADQVYAVPMKGDADVGLVPRVRSILRCERADLVHLHSRRGADIWGALAARSCGLPTVLSRRVDHPEPRWLAPWKYRLYDRVIAISQGIRQVLVQHGAVSEQQVVCVCSAVDTERFKPTGDHVWFRQEFNLAADELTVAMSAQFIARKGHREFVLAMPKILQQQPSTRFLLFGQGPLQADIEALCDQQGVRERVIFAGFRIDMDKILPCVTLLVHPAKKEGLGVALLEAAACARPIVAGRAGGIPEIVHHGLNGLLIDPDDISELAKAVSAVLAEPGRALAYGQAGREIVQKDFSIPAMVAGNYRVYKEILSARDT